MCAVIYCMIVRGKNGEKEEHMMEKNGKKKFIFD